MIIAIVDVGLIGEVFVLADGIFQCVVDVVDVDAVFTDFHLFAQNVQAVILAIHIEVYIFPLAGKFSTQLLGKHKAHRAADTGIVLVAGQQDPLFGSSHAQNIGLLIQLDLIALLGRVPAGVAPALDLHGRFVQIVCPQDGGIALGLGLMILVAVHFRHGTLRQMQIDGGDVLTALHSFHPDGLFSHVELVRHFG